LVEGVVELLGVVVFGVACEFGVVEVPLLGVVSVLLGVVAVPFGVVAVPVDEVEPGVMVLPVELLPLVPVVSGFEDCGTADPLAGTQSAVAVVEVPEVELALELGDVEEVVELLLGMVLLEVDGEVLLELLGIVLLELLGVVVLVEEFPLAVVVLVEPGALALVRGTIPAGQLLVEDALGVVVDGVVEVPVPVCDEVALPVCEEVEVEGDVVVVLVVDDVCAATHVALAVRTRSNVHFFMFSVLVKSSGYSCDAHSSGQVRCLRVKNGPA
jgi:hypothetical protein